MEPDRNYQTGNLLGLSWGRSGKSAKKQQQGSRRRCQQHLLATLVLMELQRHRVFLTGLWSIIKGERSSLPPVPVWMTSPDWSFRQDLTRGGSAVLSEDHILSGEHTGLAKNVCECVCHHPCVSIWGMHNLLAFLGREKTIKFVVYTFFGGKKNFFRIHRSHFQVHFTVQIKKNYINGKKRNYIT